jgi:putative NIF3 family GTP cyclohydrolase 1 type 2
MPGPGAAPAVGSTGTLTEVHESRIEILVSNHDLGTVVGALKKVHPYETMAYDVYPLAMLDHQAGLGRVGELASPLPLDAFAAKLKTALNLPAVKVVGSADMAVKRVAVCSGSGASLLKAAIARGAQVYVSGDLGYHTAREAQQAGIGLIDVGHFGSEHPVVDVLAAFIRDAIKDAGIVAAVEAVDTETDPFHYL